MTDAAPPAYSARVIEKIENRPGTWNSLRIGVFDGETQIGEYVRNYSSFLNTFCAWQHPADGNWYALYSRDYTSTRVMRLPSCEDIGGEERAGHGFCPTGYYVPVDTEGAGDPETQDGDGSFGFMQGCVWGDDAGGWKLQYLDLRRVPEGIIVREERFGYLELAGIPLKDAVELDIYRPADRPDRHEAMVTFARAARFDLDTGEMRGADDRKVEDAAETLVSRWIKGMDVTEQVRALAKELPWLTNWGKREITTPDAHLAQTQAQTVAYKQHIVAIYTALCPYCRDETAWYPVRTVQGVWEREPVEMTWLHSSRTVGGLQEWCHATPLRRQHPDVIAYLDEIRARVAARKAADAATQLTIGGTDIPATVMQFPEGS